MIGWHLFILNLAMHRMMGSVSGFLVCTRDRKKYSLFSLMQVASHFPHLSLNKNIFCCVSEHSKVRRL